MTRKELLSLEPISTFNETIPLLHHLYIIPTMRKHDSGYRQIEIIGIRYKQNSDGGYGDVEYAKKVATFSDVISFNRMNQVINKGFSIDIEPENNCLRIFTSNREPSIKILWNLSDFEFEIVDDTK